jgi:endonuclease-3 related protein
MPSLAESLAPILDALLARFGPTKNPAPATATWSSVAGALAHQIAPRITEKARLVAPPDDGNRTPAFVELDDPEPGTEITPRSKAERKFFEALSRLALEAEARGGLEAIAGLPTSALRNVLREWLKLGPITTEAVLLEGFGRPTFPLDLPSFRVAARHGWVEPEGGFDEALATFNDLAAADPETLATLAHGFRESAREFCRPKSALCERCPLQPWLPESGRPLELYE